MTSSENPPVEAPLRQRTPRLQFSMRAILWFMLAFSWFLVDLRGGNGKGVALVLIFCGLTPIINDVSRRRETFESSAQLLFGGVLFALVAATTVAMTWLRWIHPDSGVSEIAAFAGVSFCGVYALRLRWREGVMLNGWAFWGYFAFVAGAFMLQMMLIGEVTRSAR